MKVLIFGAGGIIGQHLHLTVPHQVKTATFCRRKPDLLHVGVDANEPIPVAVDEVLVGHKPNVVINLAGENNPDAVERDPQAHQTVNEDLPRALANWCQENHATYIHTSTQAVFSGQEPPYGPHSPHAPVNQYGCQKAAVDQTLRHFRNTIIVRPTFVLGVRPMPHIGRPNPLEQMFSGQPKQVNDRWFSPSFARDVARTIWGLALYGKRGTILHAGIPERWSRFTLARRLGFGVKGVAHDSFPGLAQRAADTTYISESSYFSSMDEGLRQCGQDYEDREILGLRQRAREIALFLGQQEDDTYSKLTEGFHFHHAAVAADFRKATPQDDDALLDWYRKTETYIWELSAYHLDNGFNYSGMCKGITDRLKGLGVKTVLCLGDGIGDLTLDLYNAGLQPTYHDLAGSKTADFARFRFWLYTGSETAIPVACTDSWEPRIGGGYDAVISLDFLEHVTDVPAWTQAIRDALVPGGSLVAQNAFNIGSGAQGSIPCHLARNDRFEKDWKPMLASLGFDQTSSNWYQKEA